LLNQAARYFPILRVLHEQLDRNPSVLEVGVGPTGVGQFWKHPFVGADVFFPIPPSGPMIPIMASAGALPFPNLAFDVVIASDVLEHVPVEARKPLIDETLRVTRKLAIFGFPSGDAAHKCDESLRDECIQRRLKPPVWLDEHMLAPFPLPELFTDVQGWQISSFGNENVAVHFRIMTLEFHRLFNYAMKASIRVCPRLLEMILRRFDYEPYYRQIMVLRRESTAAA
jgi:SAM-dependent methyltransferase